MFHPRLTLFAQSASALVLDDVANECMIGITRAGKQLVCTACHAPGKVRFARRERPQLLRDPSGLPLWLFNGVTDVETGFAHTIAVKIGRTLKQRGALKHKV